MFNFLKKRALFEQKKMIWQNFFGSKDMLDFLEGYWDRYTILINDSTQKKSDETLMSKLREIHQLTGELLNKGMHKVSLDRDTLSSVWNTNKTLRIIYDNRFRPIRGVTFDTFIDPPYGWDVALQDWD